MSLNPFIQLLSRSQATAHGLWSGLPSTIAIEIAAKSGFDWMVLDAEHAPFELSEILQCLQTIAATDTVPIVRLPEGRTADIKRYLDLGAQTLLIPMVDTAQQARDLVQAMHYPPRGIRGVGAALARASNWNRDTQYLQRASDTVCLVVQVETVVALENLSEIVAVEGVDAVFIGPVDLSASMGYIGQPDHPQVVAQVQSAIATIRAANKFVGVLSSQPELAKLYAELGADFIGVGIDTILLARSCQQLAEQYQRS